MKTVVDGQSIAMSLPEAVETPAPLIFPVTEEPLNEVVEGVGEEDTRAEA